ncbi:hypothetical protein F2P79_001993, partial [Pimephales promelas]
CGFWADSSMMMKQQLSTTMLSLRTSSFSYPDLMAGWVLRCPLAKWSDLISLLLAYLCSELQL